MKEKYWQVIASIVFGLVVPGMVVRFATNISKIQPETFTPATTITSTEPQTDSSTVLSVLTESGNIVEMKMDTYLVGVLLAEMPTTYEPAALEAQAIVARTYAAKRQQEARHSSSAVCTNFNCCQAYVSVEEYLDGLGYAEDVAIAMTAVNATKNVVLTYDGDLIEATYFHSSGGKTEDAVAVWGISYPYLQVVESPGEENLEHYTNRVKYTGAQLEALLGVDLQGNPSDWIGRQTFTSGGGIKNMIFAGQEYSGIALRTLLQLHSTAFHMEPTDDGITITTYGKGHRVGMSQTGAQAMALNGHSVDEILAHYYPGTIIDKIVDIG